MAENLRSSTINKNRGFTLLEIIISLALLSFASFSFIYSSKIGTEFWLKTNAKKNLLEIRQDVLRLLSDPEAMRITIDHPLNKVAVDCLKTKDHCDLNEKKLKFNLYDRSNSAVISSLNEEKGFTADFEKPCQITKTDFSYAKKSSDVNCPFRLVTEFYPVCSSVCSEPSLMVKLKVEAVNEKVATFDLLFKNFEILFYVPFSTSSSEDVFDIIPTKRGHIIFRSSGALQAIGRNAFKGNYSILGVGSNKKHIPELTPVLDETMAPVSNVKYVAPFGTSHYCVLVGDNRQLKCTGSNDSGDLGTGDFNPSLVLTASIFESGGVVDQVESINLAAGSGNVIRKIGGSYFFFGTNHENRFGFQPSTYLSSLASDGAIVNKVTTSDHIEALPLISSAHEIELSGSSACAVIDTDRSVTCWGSTEFGAMGDNNFSLAGDIPGYSIALPSEDSNRRVVLNPVTGPLIRLSEVVHLQSSGSTFCAIVGGVYSNRVACWGRGEIGLLGDGAKSDNYVAGFVVDSSGIPIEDIHHLSMNSGTSCAFNAVGTNEAYCWGENEFAQLGLGFRSKQVAYAGEILPPPKTINKMINSTTSLCILHTDLTVSCVGKNEGRKFGVGKLDALYTEWIPAF